MLRAAIADSLMRGSGVAVREDEAISGKLLSYVDLEKRVAGDYPLRVIRSIADAALQWLSPYLDALYSPLGLEPIPRRSG